MCVVHKHGTSDALIAAAWKSRRAQSPIAEVRLKKVRDCGLAGRFDDAGRVYARERVYQRGTRTGEVSCPRAGPVTGSSRLDSSEGRAAFGVPEDQTTGGKMFRAYGAAPAETPSTADIYPWTATFLNKGLGLGRASLDGHSTTKGYKYVKRFSGAERKKPWALDEIDRVDAPFLVVRAVEGNVCEPTRRLL
ncbi:uncharacterized protein LOC143188678 [Calliopsis andreniformis]|uniref:uncharacterized protein LOC143188678 n=1 Tax=Calliopsis andreniformis TaxID=337506 RepID=UPI003FCE43F1